MLQEEESSLTTDLYVDQQCNENYSLWLKRKD